MHTFCHTEVILTTGANDRRSTPGHCRKHAEIQLGNHQGSFSIIPFKFPFSTHATSQSQLWDQQCYQRIITVPSAACTSLCRESSALVFYALYVKIILYPVPAMLDPVAVQPSQNPWSQARRQIRRYTIPLIYKENQV
jgi:hypothetical protein